MSPSLARWGGSGDNFTDTRLDDAATTTITNGVAPFTGAYRPASTLSALNGQNANGTWRLEIKDTANGDVGTLTNWALELCSATTTLPAAPSNLQAAVASGTQVNLTWTDNASNEAGFKIERCQGAIAVWLLVSPIAIVCAPITMLAIRLGPIRPALLCGSDGLPIMLYVPEKHEATKLVLPLIYPPFFPCTLNP